MPASRPKKVTFASTVSVIEIPAVAETEPGKARLLKTLLGLLRKLKDAALLVLWMIFTIAAPALIIIMVFKVCIAYVLTVRIFWNSILELVQ